MFIRRMRSLSKSNLQVKFEKIFDSKTIRLTYLLRNLNDLTLIFWRENLCGGCKAEFYVNNIKVECQYANMFVGFWKRILYKISKLFSKIWSFFDIVSVIKFFIIKFLIYNIFNLQLFYSFKSQDWFIRFYLHCKILV